MSFDIAAWGKRVQVARALDFHLCRFERERERAQV
jgi:hypothetical protein